MKFRTAVLAACLIGFVASPAFAQGSVGVKAGLNLANVTVDEDEVTIDRLTGFLAGVYFRAAGNDVISLQPEVLFSMQGAKFSDEFEDFKLKINYIQVPVLAHINVGTAGVQPFVTLGPTFGFRLSAKLDGEGESRDFKDDVKRIDMGLAIGAGIQMKRGVSLEARYTFGLTNFANPDGENIGPDEIFKNRVISIMLGLGF